MATASEPLPSATNRRKWGSGEIDMLFEGQVHNGRSLLCMEHLAGESYVAFISFARSSPRTPSSSAAPSGRSPRM